MGVRVPPPAYTRLDLTLPRTLRDAQAEQFGGQRAIALLGAQMRAGASADEAAEALLEAAVDWQPGEPGDDTAVLIVRAGGGGSEPTPGRL